MLIQLTPISTPRNGTPETGIIDVDGAAETTLKPTKPGKIPKTTKGKGKQTPEKDLNEPKETNKKNGS